MQDIFIGVDGGGTKSKVRVEDSQGRVLGQALGGPANIRLSVRKSWEAIYQALDKVLEANSLSRAHPNYRLHIGLGLAGCEVQEAVNEFLAFPNSFQTVHLTSDAHVACVGAHNGQDGAIIIIGTGVVGYQIQAGETVKVGGWGFPHDDEGGGAWLGLEAARLTCQWLDRRIEKNALVTDVFDFFDRNVECFTVWANRANSSEFARLAPLVINHSQQQEPHALRLMKKAAHAIERVSAALSKLQKQQTSLPVCLFGGIAPFIEPLLAEDVRNTFVARQADANVGAICMIRDIVMQKEKASC